MALEGSKVGRIVVCNEDGRSNPDVPHAEEKADGVVEVGARHRVRRGDNPRRLLDAVLAVLEAEGNGVIRIDQRGGNVDLQVEVAADHLGAEEADVQVEIKVVVFGNYADEQRIRLAHQEVAGVDLIRVLPAGEDAELEAEGELSRHRHGDQLRVEARAGIGEELEPVGLETEVDRHRVGDDELDADREGHFGVGILRCIGDLRVDGQELDLVQPELIQREVDRVEERAALQEAHEPGSGVVHGIQAVPHAVEKPAVEELARIHQAVVVIVERCERRFVVVRRIKEQPVDHAVAVRIDRRGQQVTDGGRLAHQRVVVVHRYLEQQRHALGESRIAGEKLVHPRVELVETVRHRGGGLGHEVRAQQYPRLQRFQAKRRSGHRDRPLSTRWPNRRHHRGQDGAPWFGRTDRGCFHDLLRKRGRAKASRRNICAYIDKLEIRRRGDREPRRSASRSSERINSFA